MKSGAELFIIDNTDEHWKVQRYLHDWIEAQSTIEPSARLSVRRRGYSRQRILEV